MIENQAVLFLIDVGKVVAGVAVVFGPLGIIIKKLSDSNKKEASGIRDDIKSFKTEVTKDFTEIKRDQSEFKKEVIKGFDDIKGELRRVEDRSIIADNRHNENLNRHREHTDTQIASLAKYVYINVKPLGENGTDEKGREGFMGAERVHNLSGQ